MMAGSPVSFNILKGKLMSFLYNIQHAKKFMPMSMISMYYYVFFFSFFQNDYDQVQEEAKEG